MTKLKNKTQLRNLVKSSVGNTGSLDRVEIYDDYTWADMSCSTWSENCVLRMSVIDVARRCSYDNTIDQDITEMFRRIEAAVDYYHEHGQKLDFDMI